MSYKCTALEWKVRQQRMCEMVHGCFVWKSGKGFQYKRKTTQEERHNTSDESRKFQHNIEKNVGWSIHSIKTTEGMQNQDENTFVSCYLYIKLVRIGTGMIVTFGKLTTFSFVGTAPSNQMKH